MEKYIYIYEIRDQFIRRIQVNQVTISAFYPTLNKYIKMGMFQYINNKQLAIKFAIRNLKDKIAGVKFLHSDLAKCLKSCNKQLKKLEKQHEHIHIKSRS